MRPVHHPTRSVGETTVDLLPVSNEWDERLKSLEIERLRPTPPRPGRAFDPVTPVQARANYMMLVTEIGMNESDRRYLERTAIHLHDDEPISP